MKKGIILIGCAVLLLTAVGCNKRKTCRCSVKGSSKVRVIEVSKGECNQLTVYKYHNEFNDIVTDSLVCTDYDFAIDSIYE